MIEYKTLYDSSLGSKCNSFMICLAHALGATPGKLSRFVEGPDLPRDRRGKLMYTDSGFARVLQVLEQLYRKSFKNLTYSKITLPAKKTKKNVTISNFIKDNPSGSFLVIMQPYTALVIDGVLYADRLRASKGSSRIQRVFRVEEARLIKKYFA